MGPALISPEWNVNDGVFEPTLEEIEALISPEWNVNGYPRKSDGDYALGFNLTRMECKQR